MFQHSALYFNTQLFISTQSLQFNVHLPVRAEYVTSILQALKKEAEWMYNTFSNTFGLEQQ